MPGMGFATSALLRPPTLPLSEVFGPTYQGEGPATGHRCWFVRLGMCNLACEWCDTPYTWDRSRYDVDAECPPTAPDAIHDQLAAAGAAVGSLVILSGGEPLIHHRTLPHLLHTHRWHAETNGTIAPPEWWADRVEHTSVSPKLITADPEKRRIRPRALAAWRDLALAGAACFKVVVSTPEDVETTLAWADTHDVDPDMVWVMPEGTTPATVLDTHRRVVDAALMHGFRTTTRLHTLLWGEERGH